MRRVAEGVLAGVGIVFLALGTAFIIIASLPFVIVGMILFGLGLPWLVVGAATLVQRATPPQLQGRVYSAFDVLTGIPQTISIALGAVLITLVNYRWLLLIMAFVLVCATAYLLTRREQWQRRTALSKSMFSDEVP